MTPMIQLSSRGYLYAPNRKTRAMWRNMRMMKTLAPQRCMPRTSQPSVRLSVMWTIDSHATGWPGLGGGAPPGGGRAGLGGGCRRRYVVHREDHAGDRLHQEGGERGRAERLHPVD